MANFVSLCYLKKGRVQFEMLTFITSF